ncbi:glycine cleavage system aminomethyltransferase GcvT [Demequina sp. B12]|uniref:glycine cleavage system aminomethyltransferase GcvT n=1 Tax=Demequina sp. B12 TaxID=2992757 RepID=UPI00237A9309|nr:glycine cleavage system aminomethyltransferase GcvT [Demequina sp. B12]MDE0572057.1 glycine cleavage system aminomethyltransferase GcvT [Demequina sp. B12]
MSELSTPLLDKHRELGATIVDFAGWQMPLRYTSDVAEHHAVRTAAGLFDLSHMGELMVTGPDAAAALDYALVGHMSRMKLWAAKYTMICTPQGGVLDDLVVYRRDWEHFMVVANASNRETVVEELRARIAAGGFDAEVADETAAIALIAVQGPRAVDIVTAMCEIGAEDPPALKYYTAANVLLHGGMHAFVARTGYTGEDGFELFVPADLAADVWDLAVAHGADAGLVPCGLASRDSLRLEAGMPLYGNELSRDRSPFEAGLGRVVNFGRADGPERGDFVGRDTLAAVKGSGTAEVLVGLVGEGRRAARAGYTVVDADGATVGVVTSGLPSPTLGKPVAMAYVARSHAEPGTELAADVRGRREPMRVIALPFYRRGA